MNPAPLWKLRWITDPLILASASLRRAEILRAIGLPFEIVTPHIEEGAYGSWDGGEKLRQRALEKAQDVRRNYPDHAVLSADTI
ncbi:MAG TPA: Maf family protein, partial [bacterium]